jgi:2-methylcitrate dehydratase PrpD
MVNAATIHQDDFDDTSEFGPSHPTSASFPVALAMAETMGGKTGRDLILAVALGNDVTCRLSRAIVGRVFEHPWFRPPVLGLFGATAAAGVIAGADAEQHYQGLGLSLPMVGGTWASLHEVNSSVRSIRDGLAYRNAILATRMARSGLRGDPNPFDGKYGLFQAYYQGEYRPEDITSELGEFFEAERISLKPWPSNRLLHNTITAVLETMEANDLYFEDVESVEFQVGFINGTRCYPVAKGLVPDRRIDLLPNLPFNVAAAIRHRGIPLALYHDGAVADEVIEVAMPKVSWITDPAQDTTDSYEVARVQIRTVSGEVFNGECNKARGHPQNPMSIENRHSKFRDCMKYAAIPVDPAAVDAIIDCVERLESLDSVEELLALMR